MIKSGCVYSYKTVSYTLVEQSVLVRIYSEKLVIFHRVEKVAVHERFVNRGLERIRCTQTSPRGHTKDYCLYFKVMPKILSCFCCLPINIEMENIIVCNDRLQEYYERTETFAIM